MRFPAGGGEPTGDSFSGRSRGAGPRSPDPPRFGRVPPVSVGVCAGVTALYLLGVSQGVVRFTSAACLFNSAWNFTIPYQLASIAGVDRSGYVTGWAAPVTAAGLAIGPFAATFAFRSGSLEGVLWLAAALGLLSMVFFALTWTATATGHAPNRTGEG